MDPPDEDDEDDRPEHPGEPLFDNVHGRLLSENAQGPSPKRVAFGGHPSGDHVRIIALTLMFVNSYIIKICKIDVKTDQIY